MNAYVVVADTSVMVKWFRQHEVDADHALAIRNAYLAGKVRLMAPTLALYEFANVMRYKNDLSIKQVRLAYQSLLAMQITWLTSAATIIDRAVEMARRYDAPVYDVVFAALAIDAGALYVTADEQFVRRVPDLPFVRRLHGFEA